MCFSDCGWFGVEGLGDGFFEEGGLQAGTQVSGKEADEKFGFDGRKVAEEFGEEGGFLEGAFGFGDGVEEEGKVFEGEVAGGVGVLGGILL